jgi:hypothetical protein
VHEIKEHAFACIPLHLQKSTRQLPLIPFDKPNGMSLNEKNHPSKNTRGFFNLKKN